ncbi:MAG: hypothetical protein II852_05900 [Bacteroidales bacterium]|nr:hypothetical protein [Bacteroidales bacterium]MBQ4406525.1 hypothetical protein [Bacteroidales bacterium]
MKRTVISLFLCLITTLTFALPTDSPVEIVKKFGAEITAWCQDEDIHHQDNLLALTSGGENCYVNDKISRCFYDDGVTKPTDNITISTYLDIIEDLIYTTGLDFCMSDIQIVNEQDAPKHKTNLPITFVKARLEFKLKGSGLSIINTNIFWINNGKICKISD